MRNHHILNSERKLRLFTCTGFLFLFFLLPIKLIAAENRGYIASSSIPETEKPTVIMGGEKAEPYLTEDKTKLTEFQKLAREYRDKGYELQKIGDLDGAMVLYQKAAELDPAYYVIYNDLGVIYEDKGFIDRAEQSYRRSLVLNPNYLSAYSNLAMLYEGKRDLNKAAEYWQRRVELGLEDDPWTQKAKKRLYELSQVVPELRQKMIERETMEVTRRIAEEKERKKAEDMRQAKQHLDAAKRLDRSCNYEGALKELKTASSLDPESAEIKAMAKVTGEKFKRQQKEEAVRQMQAHFKNAVEHYQQDNPQGTQQELNKIEQLAR